MKSKKFLIIAIIGSLILAALVLLYFYNEKLEIVTAAHAFSGPTLAVCYDCPFEGETKIYGWPFVMKKTIEKGGLGISIEKTIYYQNIIFNYLIYFFSIFVAIILINFIYQIFKRRYMNRYIGGKYKNYVK